MRLGLLSLANRWKYFAAEPQSTITKKKTAAAVLDKNKNSTLIP